MLPNDILLFEGDTAHGHYQVVDTTYEGRPARVLYSGRRSAAQSGMARDDKPELLFDYNQRFFELVDGIQPAHILLIGGGVYTLPMALLNTWPQLKIDVVEIDAGLDQIAKDFFSLRPHANLRIFHTDGQAFLRNIRRRYDLIIVDAFKDTTIPLSLTSQPAIKLMHRRLAPNGLVAVNVISAYYGRKAKLIQQLDTTYSTVFPITEIFPAGRSLFTLWFAQNLVLVAHKGEHRSLKEHLRYGALPPLHPSVDSA